MRNKIRIVLEALPQEQLRDLEPGFREADPTPPVTIEGLRDTHCRWPVEGGYCGYLTRRGPYCAGHAKIAYRPEEDRKKRGRRGTWASTTGRVMAGMGY